MTNDQRDELIQTMQAACTVPTVPSRPLVLLSAALAQADTLVAELDDDDPLLVVIGAADELMASWSFYPETDYGSDRAIVDAQAVLDLIQALSHYRQEQSP